LIESQITIKKNPHVHRPVHTIANTFFPKNTQKDLFQYWFLFLQSSTNQPTGNRDSEGGDPVQEVRYTITKGTKVEVEEEAEVSSTDKEERTRLRALRSEDMDDYKLEDIVDYKSTEPTGE
jgi:hypothetical protein